MDDRLSELQKNKKGLLFLKCQQILMIKQWKNTMSKTSMCFEAESSLGVALPDEESQESIWRKGKKEKAKN